MFPHLVPVEEYLGDVELVDVPGVGDDDGRLGVAAPPRVVVDGVVLDGHVVTLGGLSHMTSLDPYTLFSLSQSRNLSVLLSFAQC